MYSHSFALKKDWQNKRYFFPRANAKIIVIRNNVVFLTSLFIGTQTVPGFDTISLQTTGDSCLIKPTETQV